MSQTDKNSRGPLRSSMITKGVDRATHRSLFYSMGWQPRHLEKPLVAVVNSFNELMPGHVHLNSLAQAIKLGIAEAGGTAGSGGEAGMAHPRRGRRRGVTCHARPLSSVGRGFIPSSDS